MSDAPLSQAEDSLPQPKPMGRIESVDALRGFDMLIDVVKLRIWARPFVWIGMNPLAIYMAHDLLDFEDLSRRLAGGDVKNLFGEYGDLALYIVGLGLTFALAGYLYRKKIFLRA